MEVSGSSPVECIVKSRVTSKTECSLLACSSLVKAGTLLERLLTGRVGKDCQFCLVLIDIQLYAWHARHLLKTHGGIPEDHTVPRLTTERLHTFLPPKCHSLVLQCRNMVATDASGLVQDCESFDDNLFVSAAILPGVPGMKSHRFTIEADSYNTNYSGLLELQIGEKVRLVLLTGHGLDKAQHVAHTMAGLAREHTHPFCCVCVLQPESSTEPPHLEGVAFTGDDLHAASITLIEEDFGNPDREAEVLKLKNCGFSTNRSNSLLMIFMDDKRKTFLGIKDILFLLQKHFPGTPIVGIDALKIVGVEHLLHPKNRTEVSSAIDIPDSGKLRAPSPSPSSFRPSTSLNVPTAPLRKISLTAELYAKYFAQYEEPVSIVIVLLYWE